MLKRTYSIYNKFGDIDERSKYLKKRKRVVFRDKPIIKEYYKVNNDLNKLLCEYINMYIDIDYNRLKLLYNYHYNDKKQIFEYVCYITTIKNSEDRINLLNMLQIHPDDKELQLYVDNALEEIKIAYVFDNSI
tara:strand:- start:46 stop:444 length:399 start_codon:yes stop_codon:yes gene_type:complete